MTHLDPKALEVSAAMHDHWERDKRTIGSRNALRNSAEVISAYLAALPQAEPPTWPPLNDLGRVLGFFASVIKSGEPWSETCQREYDAANSALRAVYAASPTSSGK